MENEINKIIEKAIEGDTEYLNLLMEEKMADILYLTYFFADRDYEDVSQEVAYNIIKSIHTLKNPEHFDSWIFRVARNICFKYNMKNSKKQKAEMSLDFSENENIFFEEKTDFLPEKFLMEKDNRDIVMGCINQLPQQYKEILVLRYFKDMSHKDIAETLEIPIKVVYNGINRGQNRLKGLVEDKTQVHYGVMPVPFGAAPMLAKLFEADYVQVTGGEALQTLLSTTSQSINTASTNTASEGTSVLTKVLASGVVIIATVGLIIAGLNITEPEPQSTQGVPAIEETALPPSNIKTIETLEDMIGVDWANTLMALTNSGDEAQLRTLVEANGMTTELQSKSEEETYTAYLLDKEDKRLVIYTLKKGSGSPLQIKYEFGKQDTISVPMGIDFIRLF